MALFGRRNKKNHEEPAPPVEPEQVPEPVGPQLPPVDAQGLRSMEDHRDFVLSLIDELPPFGQQLLDAIDLSLCEDVISELDLPGFDNSAMDGYAIQTPDVVGATDQDPAVLAVVGEIAAGQTATHRLSPGTAMKIMTGAPLPEGADAVVKYEDTDRGTDDVLVYAEVAQGANIRRRGEDLAAGTVVLTTGDRLHSGGIGLLAAIGMDKVMVRPRPRVVVIATGSELVDPGTELQHAGQIYDSNSFLLAAAAKEAGAQVFRVGQVSDDPDEVRQLIHDQLVRADLIITSGGVSEGDHDVIKDVMPTMGWCDFAKVAMQPGKPQGFGLIGDDKVPMIMLPGNPVSSFVSFEAFVRPVIRKLMAAEPYVRTAVPAISSTDIVSVPGKRQFARGVVSLDDQDQRRVRWVGEHGSHLLGDLARANGLIVLDEEIEHVTAGDVVPVWQFGED
ncbi:gephyrin-like molybdotransferase Glp [Propionibacteriaceae bacterium Y2011]|uniref:molybdotransferase-like divisome protein Glp n=1 Tax=Microlunatus sp. Y2014 TaxID=3418488 RepID=UPI003B47099A